MSFELSGKTALVTGGGGGLGRAIARELIRAGARVYITSRKGVDDTRELGVGKCAVLAADLSSESGRETLAATLRERVRHLHVLVNNAGTTWGAPIEEFPGKGWDKVLEVNLKAPFVLTRALLPCLEAAATRDDPARVINVGSVDGVRWMGLNNFSYTAAKAGLHQLTKVLARELGPRSITVNAVAPGPIESKMTSGTLSRHGEDFRSRTPLGRLGRPEDVAFAVRYLASPASAFVNGVVLPVDGGYLT